MCRPHEQNLFPIVQGGLDYGLRQESLRQLMERDGRIPGYAIGGLAGGEDKESFWKVSQVEPSQARPAHTPPSLPLLLSLSFSASKSLVNSESEVRFFLH